MRLCAVHPPAAAVPHQGGSLFRMVRLTAPYIPGFLAFRECEFLVALLDELRGSRPDLVPQLLFVDGNGVLHPRGFGLAAHLGVLAGIPSIGIGKNLLCVDGLEMKAVKGAAHEALERGVDCTALRGASGRVWGAAMCKVQPGMCSPRPFA